MGGAGGTTGGVAGGIVGGAAGGSAGGVSAGGASAGTGGKLDASCKKNSALPDKRCRAFADCMNGSICTPTLLQGGCGSAMMATRLCNADADCGSGKVCLDQPTPACTVGTPTQCGAACTASSCAADEQCATTGHCEPKPCTAGYACGDGMLCDAGAMNADVHGCRSASCATDGFACADTSKCDAAAADRDGHDCSPKKCATGDFTCADGFVCGDPTVLDAHGCRCGSDSVCGTDQVCNDSGYCSARPCKSDNDCDCGVCVNTPNGTCATDFYFCSMQSA